MNVIDWMKVWYEWSLDEWMMDCSYKSSLPDPLNLDLTKADLLQILFLKIF